jgi:hypothetical protein
MASTDSKTLWNTVRKRSNLILIRASHIQVSGKEPEQISLGEVLGNLDAGGYLILLLSLCAALIIGFCSGMLFLKIWPDPAAFVYLAAIPGAFAGFVTCYCLFRIRHWLRL